jgi:chromate transport protein ChrA
VVLMTTFAAVYFHHFRSAEINSHIGGLVAALAGVILANAYRIGSKHTVTKVWWLVAISAFVARLFLGLDALIIILAAGGGALALSWWSARRSRA